MINESGLAETAARFQQRQKARQKTKGQIEKGGVLAANSPTGVEKRLQQMGMPATATRAIVAGAPLESVALSGGLVDPAAAMAQMAQMQIGLERLIGNDNLIGVSFLERGRLASRAVGCIANRRLSGFGTGFLVTKRLLLTNNHVLSDENVASSSVVKMNFEVGVDREPLRPIVFKLDPATFFLTDKRLDFTLVAVEPESDDAQALEQFGQLKLLNDDESVLNGDYVNIIQHPNGEMKQLAMRENEVIDVLDDFAHYETDTAPGSSGSCVCNDFWEVVCLHHSGVPKRNDEGKILARDGSLWRKEMGEQRIDWIANEGIKIASILKFVEQSPLESPAKQRLRDDVLTVANETVADPIDDDGGDDPIEEGGDDPGSDREPLLPPGPCKPQPLEIIVDPTASSEIKIPIEILIRFKTNAK